MLKGKEFSTYFKEICTRQKLRLQEVFLNADISEGYGYKLMSGEKRTRQRDIILRLCYAAKMTTDETQTALKLYGLPELYVKSPRDALIMVCFNERPGSVIEVNGFLKGNGFDPLRSSGTIE